MLSAKKNTVPLNHYSPWVYVLVVAVLLFSIIYALPNLFGESNAVQISPKDSRQVTPGMVAEIKSILAENKIAYHDLTVKPYRVQLLVKNTTNQMLAQDAIQAAMGKKIVAAINLVPNTPEWLRDLGANPMSLGLDLQGGMYFLLDIDMQSVISNNLNSYASSIRKDLREQNLRYSGVQVKGQALQVSFRQAAVASTAEAYIKKQFPMLMVNEDSKNPLRLRLNLSEQELKTIKQYAVGQTVQVMRNRVNELGVSEASVAQQGLDRVVIELPGVQDAARAKAILGGTATLKVMMVDSQADVANAVHGQVPIGSSLYYAQDGRPVILKNQVIITGKSVTGANVGYDQQTSLPVVNVRLSGPQVSYFAQVTRENVGKPMAIVLVQQTFEKKKVKGKIETVTHTEQKVINVATIMGPLGNNFQISGLGSARAAQNLALTIRAGALPAPVRIVSASLIGPTLGAHNIKVGTISVMVALILVLLFMMLYYRLFGLLSGIALVMNLFFIVAVMSILPGATLSLPGIAGIVLNLGMAIDANVLVFERVREELRHGKTPQAAIHAGYSRAFSTIVDSHVTTLIVAIILFAVGTSAIEGFAVTLMIGTTSSIFTSVVVTRALTNMIYGGRAIKRLSLGINVKPQ